VTAEIVDGAGAVVARTDLGVRDAGRQDARVESALDLAAGDYTLRLSAASTYEESPGGSAELPFRWDGPNGAPRVAGVTGASPNPFGATTSIRFAIPPSGVSSHSLSIYDLAGRLVRRLSQGPTSAGVHVATWDGRDASGRPVAAGVYLARLEAGAETSVRKVVHVR
jgi:flagellar hook assembly protein FlgD